MTVELVNLHLQLYTVSLRVCVDIVRQCLAGYCALKRLPAESEIKIPAENEIKHLQLLNE